jgi:hypothetical protein
LEAEMNDYLRSYYHRVVNAEQELLSVIELVNRKFGHLAGDSDEYADFFNLLSLKRAHIVDTAKRAQRG